MAYNLLLQYKSVQYKTITKNNAFNNNEKTP